MLVTNYFHTIDYVFMIIYVIVLIAMGIYFKSKASESIEDYIMGGKKIPWWAMGISGMAQFLDLTGTALIVSFLFIIGPQGLFIEFRGGAVLIMVFMMLWIGKWHRRSGCLTGAQWNIFRFGDCWGGRFAQLISVLAISMFTIGMLAYLTKGVGLFLSTFLPYSPEACAYTLIALATVYTMFSGFYGVIFTDLFQSLIIVTAVIYISVKAFFAISGLGGTEEIEKLAVEVTGNPDWMCSSPQWKANMPNGYEKYTPLIPLMVWYLFRNVLDGFGKIGDPKYFGAKTDREVSKLNALWTVVMAIRWPMVMGIAVLGLIMVADLFPDQSRLPEATQLIKQEYVVNHSGEEITKPKWGNHISQLANNPKEFNPELIAGLKDVMGDGKWVEKMNLLSYDGTVNPEKILSSVLLTSVGAGLRGILILALIAASMSTFDTLVNMATGQIVNDFYRKYFRPNAETKELIRASWVAVALLVTGGIYLAANADSIEDIWGWIMMGLSGAFLVPNLMRLYWWRFNGTGTAVGSLVGMTAAIMQRIFLPEINEFYQLGYALTAGLTGGLIGTYLDKPTDPEVLKNFYLKTRPFGFWGHLKRKLPEAEQKKVTREHFFDILAIPFTLLWQVTMFLFPMLIVIHNWPAFWGAFALWWVGGAGVYFFWWRPLPKTNVYDDDVEFVKEPVE